MQVVSTFRSLPYKRANGSLIPVEASSASGTPAKVTRKEDTPQKSSTGAASTHTPIKSTVKNSETVQASSSKTEGAAPPVAHSAAVGAAFSKGPSPSTPQSVAPRAVQYDHDAEPSASKVGVTTPKKAPSTGTVIRYKMKKAKIDDDSDSSDDDTTASTRKAGTRAGVASGLQIPIGNGGIGSNNSYWWQQTLFDATLYVPLPADVRAKDLNVVITADRLSVTANAATGSLPKGYVFLTGESFLLVINTSFPSLTSGPHLL
jgi:hypothetical protein